MRKLAFETLETRICYDGAPVPRPVEIDAIVSTKPLPSNPPRILTHFDTTPEGAGYESLGIIKFDNPSDLTTANQALGYDYSNRQLDAVTHTIKDGSRIGTQRPNPNAQL